ncbi:MAG: aminoacyl-tRNA deacylase [Candidatus Bathyarchaeia archaeon]
MDDYGEKLRRFMEENHVTAEHIHFQGSVHTVEDACREANAEPDDFIKTICVITGDGKVIGAIVLGSDRVSSERIAKALRIGRPRIATPNEALDKTGYPVGGTPPFGYEASFLIDPKVMEKKVVYAGGGSPNALVRIAPAEVWRVNGGTVARIRK